MARDNKTTRTAVAGAAACATLFLCESAHALTFGTFGTWDTQARRDAATAAMQAVVDRYNIYGDFNSGSDGYIDVYYNSGVATAQASYYGAITFGGTYPAQRVAQHESNHWLGSGTYSGWAGMFNGSGNWTGTRVNQLISQFDGDGTVMHLSGVHFYGYGLNYDSEVVNNSIYMRNVAIMYAMRADMGNGPTANPWSATTVTLAASDPIGTSAFNWFGGGWSQSTYQGWSDNYFAHAGAAYSTGNYIIRTPLNTYGGNTPNFTFAGSSLTINNTNGISGGLLYKGVGTTGVLTINNLILSSGYVRHASSSADLFQLAGTVALSGTSTIDAAQGNVKILSTISGTGSVNFIGGAFSTTLTGANTYTGTTTVSSAKLIADNNAALGQSNVVVTGTGTTLHVTAGRNVGGLKGLSVASGSTLSFDGGGSMLTLASGVFTIGNINLDLNNAFNAAGSYTLIDGLTGANTLGTMTFVDVSSSFTYAVAVSSGNVVLTVAAADRAAVPEPATLTLLGLGGLTLGRRRKQ